MEYKLLAKLATMAASLEEVAKLFALTEEQMTDPAAGRWLVDRIKQLQTAYTIRKGLADNVDFHKAKDPGLPTTPNDTESAS